VELLVRFDPCKEKHNVFIIKVEGERSWVSRETNTFFSSLMCEGAGLWEDVEVVLDLLPKNENRSYWLNMKGL
jgi:hypothetical protein